MTIDDRHRSDILPAGRFEGRTAVITGANGGIGRAIADHMLGGGANVVLSDMDVTGLSEAFGHAADRVLCLRSDVTDWASSQSMVSSALERFGRIDMAVFNAAIEGPYACLGELGVEDFDRVMAVNVRGIFMGLSLVMPVMKKHGGSIVLMSSTAGLRGSFGLSPYVASKHAVIGLMRTAAIEGAPHNVRVNTVHPGPIDTRMLRSLEETRGVGAERQPMEMRTPLRRIGQPAEVAGMIGYLCSREAAFCTGQTYVIDGGSMFR